MERWKFFSALIPLKIVLCVVNTNTVCKATKYLFKWWTLKELKLKWSMEKSKNIWERRFEKLSFCLVFKPKRVDIADDVLHATIYTERTFKYKEPN